MTQLARNAALLLGATAVRSERLHGGDLSEVVRIYLKDGRVAVAKSGPLAGAEATMLRAIAATGAPTPDVLAVSGDVLVMTDLGEDEGPNSAWGDLGHVLRRLHGDQGGSYGWPVDHAFGSVAIPNAACDDWPEFWARRRLLPACPHIPPDLARKVELLAARLPDLLPKAPPASLLHGDLWSGNVMARAGRITGLIDPAVYRGHAEVDLAMLQLFGHPGPAFWHAYGDSEPGAEERLPIYQLWPALVHLRLFGRGYQGLVERCLKA